MTALSDPDLASTLQLLAQMMEQHARDDWWIIGSAAVALHLCDKDLGGDPGKIADVDVITSRRDLEVLYGALALANTPDASKQMFTSELFGVWSEPPLEVEFMAGLKVRSDEDWQNVEPRTRKAMDAGGSVLFVPERSELISILQSFGREKDLQRAASLAE